MNAEHAASEGLLARTVRETLGAIASPGVVQRILEAAYYHARVATVPEDPEKARRFVEGPLRASIHAALGAETAEQVLDNLHPLLEMAGSHVRAKDAPPEPARPPLPSHAIVDSAAPPASPQAAGAAPARERWRSTKPSSEGSAPAKPVARLVARDAATDGAEAALVLIATLDRSGIQRLARRLLGHATVRPVHDVFELVYALDANAKRRPVVVLDCCLPAVEPQSVAAMLGGLADAPRVVLWGATEAVRDSLEGTLPSARDWIPMSADATDEDVATLLKSLL